MIPERIGTPLKDAIRSNDRQVAVVIGDEAAKAVADHLAADYDVTLLTDDRSVVKSAESVGVDAHHVDPTEGGRLKDHARGADVAVVGATRDRETLLAARLLRHGCGVDRVAVRINDPENRDLFRDLDVELLDTHTLLAPEIERVLAGPDRE